MNKEKREAIRQEAKANLAYIDTLMKHEFQTVRMGYGLVTACQCGWLSEDPAGEASYRMHKEIGYSHVLDMLKDAGYAVVKTTGKD